MKLYLNRSFLFINIANVLSQEIQFFIWMNLSTTFPEKFSNKRVRKCVYKLTSEILEFIISPRFQ
jgi:hypothetical protein